MQLLLDYGVESNARRIQLNVGFTNFQESVKKCREKKINSATLTKRGNAFLAQFPDLQVRFWRLMSDPRAFVYDPPRKQTAMTGAFAPLEPHLVWQHILHGLSHPAAARVASCCKWLSRMVTPRLLVNLRQRWENRLPTPVVGGNAPLRLRTVDDQEVTLYIIDDVTRLLGLGYAGRYYVLDMNSVQDPLRTTWRSECRLVLSLFQLLNNIAKAPPGEPLDLRMWAKIAPLALNRVSLEITAHGQLDPIARMHGDDGAKFKFFARGLPVGWGPLVQ
jgi:hypothetical protein